MLLRIPAVFHYRAVHYKCKLSPRMQNSWNKCLVHLTHNLKKITKNFSSLNNSTTPFFSGLYTKIWITQCFFGLENFVVSRRFDWKHQTEFEDVLISINMGLKIKLWAKLSYDNPKQRTCRPDGYYFPRRSYRVILSCLKDTFRYDSSRLFPGDLQTFEICVWMPNWITRESVISKSGAEQKANAIMHAYNIASKLV